MTYHKLLLDEPPLQVLPTLAELIGLNEAIILQQIHYWVRNLRHEYEGHRWMYNSVKDWKEQFPWWSESTIKRTLTHMRSEELVITGNFNQMALDKTLWYRVNYDRLEELMTQPLGQNDPIEEVNLTQAIPETTTETTEELKTSSPNGDDDPFAQVATPKNELVQEVPTTSEILEEHDRHGPEPQYVDDPFDDVGTNRPKWKVPRNDFQKRALKACGRKYFASRKERADWNKIEKSMIPYCHQAAHAVMHTEWVVEKIEFVEKSNKEYKRSKLTKSVRWTFPKLLSMINNEEKRKDWVSHRRTRK